MNDLIAGIPQTEVTQWIILAIFFFTEIFPKWRRGIKDLAKNDGMTINERVDKVEARQEEQEQKLNRDFERLNVHEELINQRIASERATKEDLNLLMTSVMEILATIDTDGAKACVNKIVEHLRDQHFEQEEKRA